MDAEKADLKKDEKQSKPEAEKPKKKEESDRVENIVALSVFFLLGLIIVAVFTRGFGLFDKNDTSDRYNVQIGNDPFKGSTEPKIVMVVFSDYECPFCKKAELTVRDVMAKYNDSIVLVFKDFPLTMLHPNALNAALASECAKEEGKYWEYHDYLFDNNDKLGVDYLKEYAKFFGMDSTRFDACLDSQKYMHEIELDKKAGMAVGVSGTPVAFINGRRIVGAQPESEFVKIIEEEIALKK